LNTIEEHASFGGVQGVYTHESEVVSGSMEFSVYVPPQAKRGPRPVLYYLSGLTCTQDNVTTKSGFQKYASEQGLTVVCPDTSPRGSDFPGEHENYDFGSGAGFYLDATASPWSSSYRMYSYIVEELPQIIAANFQVETGRSGIFGHSMGGHGALVIGFRNPDKYQSISAFAPIVAPMQVPWGQKAFTNYLGGDPETWRQYDAIELIKSGFKASGEILIDQGTADPFLNEQLRPELFEAVCQNAGQPVRIRRQEAYDHSYFFISSFMQDHIEHHAKILDL
jgi:S-formylglutathione hydrolase